MAPSPRTSPMAGPRRRLVEPGAEVVAERPRVLLERRVEQLVERRERGGARQRVAAERAAEAAGVRRVHDVGAAGDAGDGQAAAQRLAPHDQVGLEPPKCSTAAG